jgi:hypothetical protein
VLGLSSAQGSQDSQGMHVTIAIIEPPLRQPGRILFAMCEFLTAQCGERRRGQRPLDQHQQASAIVSLEKVEYAPGMGLPRHDILEVEASSRLICHSASLTREQNNLENTIRAREKARII